jgi:hypothetical protein
MAPPRCLLLVAVAVVATASPIGDWLDAARQQVNEELQELQARTPQFSNPFGSVFGSGVSLPASVLSQVNPGGGFLTLTVSSTPSSGPPSLPTGPPPIGPPKIGFPVFSTAPAGGLTQTLGPDTFSSIDPPASEASPTPAPSTSLPPLLGGGGNTFEVATSLDLNTDNEASTTPPSLAADTTDFPVQQSTAVDLSQQAPAATATSPPSLEISWG